MEGAYSFDPEWEDISDSPKDLVSENKKGGKVVIKWEVIEYHGAFKDGTNSTKPF